MLIVSFVPIFRLIDAIVRSGLTIAWRLAKRYAQDEHLDWGVAADAPAEDKTRLKEAGHTLIAKKKSKAS